MIVKWIISFIYSQAERNFNFLLADSHEIVFISWKRYAFLIRADQEKLRASCIAKKGIFIAENDG